MKHASDISNCDLPIYVKLDESWYINTDEAKGDTDLITKKILLIWYSKIKTFL